MYANTLNTHYHAIVPISNRSIFSQHITNHEMIAKTK